MEGPIVLPQTSGNASGVEYAKHHLRKQVSVFVQINYLGNLVINVYEI